ncbi:hypothetical protein Tco_0576802 [Tanacetum coccineum]
MGFKASSSWFLASKGFVLSSTSARAWLGLIFVMVRTQRKLAEKVLEIIRHQDYKTWVFWRFLSIGFVKKIVWTAKAQKKVWSAKENGDDGNETLVRCKILQQLPFSSAAIFANIMCRQPLPPPLPPPSAKLMIMALEEYGYQSRRGIRGEKSPNPRGDPRSPLGTGMGMKNDSPTGMGMRLINGDGDDHLDAEMLSFEIRIDHTFVLTVYDFHHMVEMCYCHIDRMAVMGMCFDHVGVMSIGKCCHIVGVGGGMMVVHILEFVVHVVFVCL